MHCLVLSDTFPNKLTPWRQPDSRRQVECLTKFCKVTVINPIPWPWALRDRRFRALALEKDTVVEGVDLYHPLFYYLPVIGRSRMWRGQLSAARRVLKKIEDASFDVILATFAYPHGLAARYLGRELGIPYVIEARGSDLHSAPARGARRARTIEAVRDATAVVPVAANLAEIAKEFGAKPENIHILTGGIDANMFTIVPRTDARKRLGLSAEGKIVLFVGSLLPVKRLDVLVQAMAEARFSQDRPLVVLAGDGPLRGMVEKRAAALGIADRFKFLGYVDPETVCLWMNASDLLVLASRNEGCPNVVIEALACGTPVVASRVGAVPELVNDASGLLVPSGDSAALAKAIHEALHREWNRSEIRKRIGNRSWERNAERLYNILKQAASRGKTM